MEAIQYRAIYNGAGISSRHNYEIIFMLVLYQLTLLGLVLMGLDRAYSPYVKSIGALLVIYSFLINKFSIRFVPFEIRLFGMFVAWILISGIYVVNNIDSFIVVSLSIISALFISYVTTSLIRKIGDARYFIRIYLIAYIVSIIIGYYTGDLKIAFQSIATSEEFYSIKRISGLYRNSNLFGLFCLNAQFCFLYLIILSKSKFKNAIYFLLVIFISILIILSGSRKIFLASIFFLLLMMYAYLNNTLKLKTKHIIWSVMIILFIIVIFYYLFTVVYDFQEFAIYKRFIYGIEDTRQDEVRLIILQESINNFKNKPITGVGTGQFRYYTITNLNYAHSGYAEILGSSGGVGFILYYGIYFVIIIRLLKLTHYSKNFKEKSLLTLFISYMLCVLSLELGLSYFENIYGWIILSIIIGQSYVIQQAQIRCKSADSIRLRQVINRFTLAKK